MNAKRTIPIALAFLLLCGVAVGADEETLHILVFSSDACPHCKAQKSFIDELDRTHDRLDVLTFEVRHSADNRRRFQEIARAHGVDAESIPAIFVGGGAWIGDSELIRQQIANQIKRCLEQGAVRIRALRTVRWIQRPPYSRLQPCSICPCSDRST